MNDMIETVNKTPIEIALQIDEDGMTTARKLYEWLELDESHYSRWCKSNILDNPFAEEGKDYSPYKANNKGRGNYAEDYRISATYAKKISMMQKGERGEQARDYFIGCEQLLARLAEQRHKTEIERAKGIAVRQALTKALQQSTENDRMHGHAYSTYTNIIYKSIFGMDARHLREKYGVSKKEDLRDYFSEEELKQVQNAEMLVSALVGYGWGYDEIKGFLMDKNTNRIAA